LLLDILLDLEMGGVANITKVLECQQWWALGISGGEDDAKGDGDVVVGRSADANVK
jgi:hypothetical protein